MNDLTELPYPEWQLPLQEAMLELGREKLAEKTLKAEAKIFKRLRELQQSNNGQNERAALIDGLSKLRAMRRDRRTILIGSKP